MKIKIILSNDGASAFETKVNQFLEGIDIRQIIKMEQRVDDGTYRCFIYYVGLDDIRDLKIDNILISK